jgi:hypothetical protein
MIPIAAMTLLAIVFAVVALKSRWEQRNRYLAMEQELARLNTPSTLRDVPSTTPPLTLTPGAVRSAEAETELTPPANAPFVELHLIWTQKEHYPSYQATIHKIDEEQRYTVRDLQLDNGNAIRFRVPTRYLTRGLYQIEVNGIGADGTTGPAEEYQFMVKQ